MRAIHEMGQILTHSSCFTQSGQEPLFFTFFDCKFARIVAEIFALYVV